MSGQVVLIGAGCGDYDLITLRGAKWLERCDCVVYDALVDRRLLNLVPEKAEKLCVGKRSGRHSETQENINRLLVEKAGEGLCVARLKGGDPFVFGRGGEEIAALENAGIEYTIVPGISSSVAVPELAGIPVTHRGTARSFHVITGHTGDGLEPDDIAKYAHLGGTLVFLMGLGKLDFIVNSLIGGGLPPETPAAVISNGAGMRQRIVRATAENIACEVKKQGICPPAVTVIGETAAYDFSPTLKLPLDGIRVGVTGTKRFTQKLSERLTAVGADVVSADFLKVHMLDGANDVTRIGEFDWVVLTSVNGAEIFFERLAAKRIDIRRLSHLKFAVIGSGTKAVLVRHGIFPDLMPETYTSESLGEKLVGNVGNGERIMLYRAKNGSLRLTEILGENGISHEDVKAYSVADNGDTLCEFEDCDFLVFASASGVNAFFGRGLEIPENTTPVCIGNVCADTLLKHGVSRFITADSQTADGIVGTILREAESRK